MGLDMYLTAERYLWSIDDKDQSISTAIKELIPETNGMEIKTVSVEAMYWRKANAIHKWFVDTLQDGVDDCQTTPVSCRNLVRLRAVCQEVLDNRSIAAELLPASSGFFFGGTEYNEWYFDSLQRTVESINRIEKQLFQQDATGEPCSMWKFNYRSSW